MKKLLILGILVILMLTLIACEEEQPSGEEVMIRVLESMEEVDSFKEDMDINIQLHLEADEFTEDSPLAMDVTADSHIILDLANQEMAMTMEYDIASGSEDMTMKMEMFTYLVDNYIYTLMDMPIIPGEWTKMEAPEDYWGQASYAEIQMKLLKASDVTVIAKERKENVECYVLEMEPDIMQMLEMIMEQAQMPMGQMMDTELEQIGEILQDYSIKLWVDEEEYLIIYAEFIMKIGATPEMFGEYGEEGLMSLNATMEMRAYDYNEPVDIILPEEAKEAKENIMW